MCGIAGIIGDPDPEGTLIIQEIMEALGMHLSEVYLAGLNHCGEGPGTH